LYLNKGSYKYMRILSSKCLEQLAVGSWAKKIVAQLFTLPDPYTLYFDTRCFAVQGVTAEGVLG
jgi:hypothetical protein